MSIAAPSAPGRERAEASASEPLTRPGRATPAPAAAGRATAEPVAPLGPSVALLIVDLVVTLGFVRLFDSNSFLVPTLVVLLTAHGIGWLGRRRDVSGALAVGSSLVAICLVTAWVALGASTTYGLVVPATVSAAHHALALVPRELRELAAPAPVTTGFLLLTTLGMGLVGVFADWAAFRAGSIVLAVVPSLEVLVLTGGLGTPGGGSLEAAAWLLAVLALTLSRELPRRLGPRRHRPRAWSAWLAAGSALALLATGIATVTAPLFPGAGGGALVHWHGGDVTGFGTGSSGHGRGSFAVSPLVSLKSEKLTPSSTVAFTVQTQTPTYWQLTTLDHFDGIVWTASADPGSGTATLPGAPPASVRATERFQISHLSEPWLPVGEQPLAVSGISRVRWHPETASVTAAGGVHPGTTYTVVSAVPDLSPQLLAGATVPHDALSAANLQLPSGIPARVRTLALEVTAGASTPFTKALDLERFFRTKFTYNLDVPPSSTTQDLVRFLFQTREGFCQQFAGAFAVLARELGLPTRIAIGFTYGEQESGHRWVVRALDAHAWPEVLLAPYGWVAFEPTPGRGAPTETSYAGVTPGETDPAAPSHAVVGIRPSHPGRSPSRAGNTTGPHGSLPHGTHPGAGVRGLTTDAGGRTLRSGPHPGGPARRATTSGQTAGTTIPLVGLVMVLVCAGLGLDALFVDRRRRAQLRGPAPVDRLTGAWRQTTDALALAGAAPRAAESAGRFARRVGTRLEEEQRAALARLSEQTLRATFSREPPSGEHARQALEDAAAIRRAILAGLPRGARLRWRFDPRTVDRASR